MALVNMEFRSQALNRKISFLAILPNDTLPYIGNEENRKPLKTWYLLHGMTNSASDWLTGTNIKEMAERYPLCVIMVNGENSFYANSDADNRMFETLICDELITFTRSVFPLSNRWKDTFIGGYSMGGFGSTAKPRIYAAFFFFP